MKNLHITTINPETNFIVTKNDINNNKALLPNVLYDTMEAFATTIIENNPDITNISPKLYKLEILKNAFLDDKLLLQSSIKKYNETELQLSIVVKRKEKKQLSTICKAIFKFQLKGHIPIAS